ncbi:hypothetical protein RI129_003742 [Pyrocoelia pectoralis]|uniref:Nucleoporin Nup133/Nup155-like N-terminal domain-containing protein n=1 Tax=Pyrocoelia pectoralis TaxID=417401 RepID=A0AAN7VHF4_9COLE
MDRSFHSPFSPRSRPNISSRRVLPGFQTPSKITSSGRSVQLNQIILKSSQNYAERFGQPLPVLVTEAIIFADRNVLLSARISKCGYAWIVCGRRLLIWQYRPSTTQKKVLVNNQCFELQLPQSDLAHRAELVSVSTSSASVVPSCIAVSPEGVVRYWPSVIHDGVSVEQVVDLQGQECDSLTEVGDLGCILATTTCSVVWVQPSSGGSRASLTCHTLRTPTGWLGGLNRRISSFIFGPMSTDHSTETRLVRVLTVQESENAWIVYVLAGHSLQKWKLQSNNEEQLIFVTELSRLIRDSFCATVWEQSGGDHSDVDTWLLDLQSDKDSIVVLAAAVNIHISPQIHYAMVFVPTNKLQAPNHIRELILLKMSGIYREENATDSLSYRLLFCGSCAYLYNQHNITVFNPPHEPDVLKFNNLKDCILGGAVCTNSPIFFLRNHGLVSISPYDEEMDLNISVSSRLDITNDTDMANLSIFSMDVDKMFTSHSNTASKIKAAFIFHIKNQQSASQEIVRDLLAEDSRNTSNSTINKSVIDVGHELLDDTPAGDPRWIHGKRVGIGSSYSMQILHQLQDKLKVFNLFIRFLQDLNFFNHLSTVNIRHTTFATVHVLGELPEKIAAAISLKRIGSNEVFEKAVDMSINDSEVSTETGLTKQDILFSEVRTIYKILQELVNRCDQVAHSDLNPSQVVALIKDTNDILLVALKDIIQQRQQNQGTYVPNSNALKLAPEYIPWTAALGSEGLHDCLMIQQSLTYNYGAKITSDGSVRNILYDQLVFLLDFILDGYKSYVDSVQGTGHIGVALQQYHIDRHKLISVLLTEKQWEKCAKLAEKYLDFEALIKICELTNNQHRLENYMQHFSSEGFSEFLYAWYLQENQPGKLISHYRTLTKSENTQKLSHFLTNHPSLAWIQNIYDDKFSSASTILKDLALKETESVVRQKTMFSISKLAMLASDDNEDDIKNYVENINAQLELITLQEEVPDYVLQQFGYDTTNRKVLSPKELIHLYTSVEYKEAGDVEFKKALDLLGYVSEDELRSELLLHIWKAAILRDSWLEGNIDSPMEILQNTLFFKVCDLARILGGSAHDFLPPLDALMEIPELSVLHENKNFQYLIKLAYEYLYNNEN